MSCWQNVDVTRGERSHLRVPKGPRSCPLEVVATVAASGEVISLPPRLLPSTNHLGTNRRVSPVSEQVQPSSTRTKTFLGAVLMSAPTSRWAVTWTVMAAALLPDGLVGPRRTVSANSTITVEEWTAARARSRLPHRHSLCPSQRHPVADAAARTRLRLWDGVLAPAARLAEGQQLGPRAFRDARLASSPRPD
jgi:hypothetical protein